MYLYFPLVSAVRILSIVLFGFLFCVKLCVFNGYDYNLYNYLYQVFIYTYYILKV